MVDYDLIIGELSKNLKDITEVDSVTRTFNRPSLLYRLRSLHLGAGDDSQLVDWVFNQLDENGIIISLGSKCEELKGCYASEHPEAESVQIYSANNFHKFLGHRRFKKIFVVGAKDVIDKFGYWSLYTRFSPNVTDDVVFFLLN